MSQSIVGLNARSNILLRYYRLDVSQHMSLCRHYVRELRRSVLVATPEGGSRPSSTMLDNIPDIPTEAGPSGYYGVSSEKDADSRLSAFLRSENPSQPSPPVSGHSEKHSSEERPPRPSFMNSTPETRYDSSNSPGHTVARTDIRRSAEKILYTYLIPDSEREIVLPSDMLTSIIEMVERDGRDDPEVFDQAKDYVFQAMERDAFPGFLQAKALGNLVPLSILARLAFGLISFWGAFWASFYVVLTDKPRATRCWVRLPYNLPLGEILTYIPGHTPIRGGIVLHHDIPIQNRPVHGSTRFQRVYIYELAEDTRTICPFSAKSARLGDVGICPSHRCRVEYTLYSCAGYYAMMTFPWLL